MLAAVVWTSASLFIDSAIPVSSLIADECILDHLMTFYELHLVYSVEWAFGDLEMMRVW